MCIVQSSEVFINELVNVVQVIRDEAIVNEEKNRKACYAVQNEVS